MIHLILVILKKENGFIYFMLCFCVLCFFFLFLSASIASRFFRSLFSLTTYHSFKKNMNSHFFWVFEKIWKFHKKIWTQGKTTEKTSIEIEISSIISCKFEALLWLARAFRLKAFLVLFLDFLVLRVFCFLSFLFVFFCLFYSFFILFYF